MKQLELKEFLNYTYLASLTANPGNTNAAYVVSKARLEENDYVHELFVFDEVKSRRVADLGNDSRYFWETDTTILLPLTRNQKEKDAVESKQSVFYRLDLSDGTLSHAYTFPIPVGSIRVLPNNLLLLSSCLTEEDHKLFDATPEERTEYNASIAKDANFEVFEEIPFYFNGSGFTKAKRSQMFLYSTIDASYKALGSPNEDVSLYSVNEDETSLLFTRSVAIGKPTFYDTLYTLDLQTREETCLYNKLDTSISRAFTLNNTVYVFATNMKDHGINQNPDLYQVIGNALVLISKFGFSTNNSIGSDARFGGSISSRVFDNNYYFVGTYRDRSVLYMFDGQQISRVFEAQGSLDGWVFINNNPYGIGLYQNSLQELYKLNFKENQTIVLTHYNDAVFSDTYRATPQHIEYTNDGVTLDGWVLLPDNYDSSKKYPAILDIHGGPKTIYSDVFYHEMQAWTNLGYIVFFCNPRGGDAYGNDFMNIFGRYGDIDYADIMKFTDIVVDKYAIDTDRIGVTGGSYGGFMTNWIVGHTNRFKVAATQRSISNWISFYGTSDIGVYFAPDQMAADPFNDTEKMWNQSPLKYARNVKTPLLFIHSEEDYRCPIEQGMQFFTTIKENGVDTRFVWIRGENHDLSRTGRPQSRVKRLEEITNWMNKYLLD